MVLLKEVKKGTSVALLQKGMDEEMVGLFNGMLLPSAKCQRPSGEMGKLPVKEDSENHSKDQSFLFFGAMVEYHPISTRDQQRRRQFGKNVLPGISLGYELIAG